MDNLKPKHKFLKWFLLAIGALVVLYAVYFVYQVLTIRQQILAGTYDWNKYGADISGSGGANISTGTYDIATSDDPFIGADKPVVTIVEFGDFQCPFCQKAFPIVRALAAEFKDDVKLIYRDFPLDDLHPWARLAAQAGYCAEAQGKFWGFHDKLFQNQDKISRDYLFVAAAQSGLDSNNFRTCLDSKAAQAEVEADQQDGLAAGVSGTPTWFINGVRVAGVIPEDVFRKIIEGLIKK